MERQKKIIDASVIVKLFAEEENSEEMFKVMQSHINNEIALLVPELIFLEVLNALRYKKFNLNASEKANINLWNFQLESVHLDAFLLNKAIKNSMEFGLSIYDAVYVSLAQIHGVPLITADEKLLKIPNAVSLKEI